MCLSCTDKNIVRHTAHTIVSWPNPKQWLKIHRSEAIGSHYFDLVIPNCPSCNPRSVRLICVVDELTLAWINLGELTPDESMWFDEEPRVFRYTLHRISWYLQVWFYLFIISFVYAKYNHTVMSGNCCMFLPLGFDALQRIKCICK